LKSGLLEMSPLLDSPSPCCTGVAASQGRRPRCSVHTEQMALLVPFAHVGHWLWALYLPPVLIVLGSIARTSLSERRNKRDD